MNFFSGDDFIQFVREVSPTCKTIEVTSLKSRNL